MNNGSLPIIVDMTNSQQESYIDDTQFDILYERWSERVKRGFLRFIVLKIFTTQKADGTFPQYSGSSLIKYIKNQTNDNWEPSYGSIYPIISEMEEEGTIELVKDENRFKEYKITKLGIKLLDKLVEDSILFRSNFHDLDDNQEEAHKNRIQELYRHLPLDRVKSQQRRFKIMADLLAEIIEEKKT